MIQELTKRELSLLKQGKLIVSREQEAVCYLVAKYSIKEKLPNFTLKGVTNYSIYCGMNPETFRRNVEKYKLLFLGKDQDEEETSKEVLYPKIINAFYEFTDMNENDVYQLAESAFTDDNKSIGIHLYEHHLETTNKSQEEYKKKDKLIKTKVSLLYNSLNSIFKDSSKSKRQAINKTANELNINVERVMSVWNKDEFLKNIK